MEVSKKGNTVYARMGIWLEKDGSIHLSVPADAKFHVAVNQDPKRRNGHPTLFRQLARCLRENGVPAPPEED